MNIQMNEKEVTPLNLVKTIYASVIEDVYNNFQDYAKVFINNYDDYNEEELKAILMKKEDFNKKLNTFMEKNWHNMKFEVGQVYQGKDGNDYKVISIVGNQIDFICNKVKRHFRFIQYCGNDTVMQYGMPFIKAGKIVPIFDTEIDVKIKPKTIITLNKNIKGYIDVFKAHKRK